MGEIAIQGVGKSFGGQGVLEDISLTIADGEMMVILGPSGCGKSTLLRLIAGLERIDRGEIRIGGRRVNELEPMDRDIAMVFQSYALYPHMSVFDNMAYGLRNRRVAKPEIDRRVRAAAAVLGLAELLARKPRQLSGGQRQRVAMGRCIVREPLAFLFDEPLSNLDAKLRVTMRLELKQLQRRLRTTSVYVTHDQVEAMTLGDRLTVLNAGRIEQVGPPLEVYRRPATSFVAGFLGAPAMNLVPGTVSADGTALELGTEHLPLAPPRPDLAGQPVLAGMRPEQVRVTGAERGLALTVTGVEALGADSVIHGRSASGAVLSLRASCNRLPNAGDRLAIEVGPGDLHLFSTVDGKRLSD